MASENNWEPAWVGEASLQWVDIPGTDVSLQIQKGWPLSIMRAFAADFHAYVEPLRDADSACYTPTNSVSTSNHLNGTAMDLNWNSHKFHVKGTFSGDQMRTIRELLAFYEDTIFWAGDWHDPIDEMHWQMGYDTFNNPHTGDVIARKIRPDGYSLFRRGTTSPSPVNTGVDVLARATGLNAARANEILPMVVNGLRRAECDNVNRIAMWLAQIGHESGSFRYTEEIQSGDESTDRWLYKGRTWIQITWRSNYAAFSKWCQRLNLVPTETYFVDHPKELAELKWAGLGAAWYWTVARADINRLSDSGDIVTVTQRINGGQNGIDDRRARYSRALGVGTDLLGLISTGDDFLSALSDDEQRQLFDRVNQTWGATFNKVESKSIYRDPGGEHTESNMWSTKDLIRNMDGFAHQHYVEDSALLGDFDSIRRVTMVAAGQGTANDQGSINRARAVLARIEAANPKALQAFIDAQKAQ